jgi:membrane protein DedA with SNARE-associated domain
MGGLAVGLFFFALVSISHAENSPPMTLVERWLATPEEEGHYPKLQVIVIVAISTLISEDLACIGAGLLVAQDRIDYPTAALGAFIGIFFGDLLLFWVGYHWGRAALRRRPLKWFIRESAIQESMKWFARKGPIVVLLSRFVPGSRFPTFVTAGMLHTNFWIFFVFFLVAGLIWAPLLVWLSMRIGERIIETLFAYKLYTISVIAITVLLIWLLFKIVIPMFSFKGRRMLWGRWRRLVRWEFWPIWAIYPPIVLYILYLGIRFRSFTLFTLANPAIHLSGLVGESKRHILDGLKHRRDLIARYEIIPADLDPQEKERRVIDFIDRHGFALPVVLKPDAGQRGLGVKIARNVSAVADYFAVPRPDTIVQEFAPGFEFSIFYYRMPGQPRGHIFSITEKRFPMVVGDGKHDLEHLIIKDPRAVCMAPYYLKNLDDRRYMVLAEDETLPLIEIGSHCRGTLFYDGRWINTPELERTIDELTRGFEGFYYGRYDIRTASLDELRLGCGFKVIELNGVTAESTNMYDPVNGLFDAYSILARQWFIAFKVGDRNRRKGMKPATLREFFKAIVDYRAAPEA